MNIESLKKVISSKIDANLIKEIEKTKEVKENILNSQLLPEIVEILSQFYKNTNEQAELQIEAIKTMAISDFFRKSNNSIRPNFICFKTGPYEVLISKSLMKSISVERVEKIFVPLKPSFNHSKKTIVELYLNQGENFNYKEFVDTYLINIKNTKPTFFSRRKVKDSEVLRMLKKMEAEMEEFNFKLRKWNKEIEKIEKQKKEDINFVESIIEDLNIFKNSGWKVHINLKSYKEYKDLLNLFE